MSPFFSLTPKLSTLRDNHATAVTGLPNTASLRPSATTSPLRVSFASIALTSISAGDTRALPSTKPADEALSAMVSHILICQSLILVSMSSIDGTNASVAASTSSSVHSAPGRSSDRMKPTSTSTRGNRYLPGLHRHVFEHLHLVEQMPIVGLVDAHHLLHHLRRQPHLVPHHPGALGDPLADVDQLDLVGVDDVDIGVAGRQRGDRLTAPLGLRKVGGQLVADRNTEHLPKSPRPCDRASSA